VILSSGDYYFDEITVQGGFTLQVDLTSCQPINIYVVGDATFAQNNTLMVKGAGTGGSFVPLDQVPSLARFIYFETHGRFVMGGANDPARPYNIWGGTVYASQREGGSAEVQIGQFMRWYGAVWAFDSLDFADHGRWTHVPLDPKCESGSDFCNKTAVTSVLSPSGTRFFGNQGLDALVRIDLGESIQAALDTVNDDNGDGYVFIGVIANANGAYGGHTTQHFEINRAYARPMALIGCSVTVHDDDLEMACPRRASLPPPAAPPRARRAAPSNTPTS
jgi:hypothetical protein